MFHDIANGIRHILNALFTRYRGYPVMKDCVEAFSLHSVQLYVCDVGTKQGETRQGLAFELPRQGWSLNSAVVVARDDAVRFVEFLSQIEARRLPCSLTLPRDRNVLEWEARRFRSQWHGGGGVVGYLRGAWRFGQANAPKVIITIDSARALRDCIKARYCLDDAAAEHRPRAT